MKRPRKSWADILEQAGATVRGCNMAALAVESRAKAKSQWAGFPSVFVPIPPSANNLYPGKQHRYTSKEYEAWKEVAYPIVQKLAPPASYPCEVWLVLRGNKVRKSRDIANLEKATGDSLVACGIIKDDKLKYVVGTHQIYRPDDGEPRVEITFTRPPDA